MSLRAAAIAALLLGCGDVQSASTDASTLDTSVGGDVSDPFPKPDTLIPDTDPSRPFSYDAGPTSCVPCPATAPPAGAPCDSLFLQCEYGDHPFIECNDMVECLGVLDGGLAWSTNKKAACQRPTTGGECPASRPVSGPCTEGLTCGYKDGFCLCSSFGWRCDLNPACPTRPRLGCSCAQECDRLPFGIGGRCQFHCGPQSNFTCAD